MTSSRSDPSAWPAELALQLEEACHRFEAAWRAGHGPRIEAYLGETPEPGRSVLLRELLAVELGYRLGSGGAPTPGEYDGRFPGHTELVREAFARALTDGPQVTGPEDASAGGACTPCPTGPYDPADSGAVTSDAGGVTDGGDRPRAAAGRRGRFTLLRPHAQGGLGTVSLAFDETLRRQVALKEIRPDRRGNARVRQRFLAEAEITGQLEHPGVVPVHALEEGADGQPYYAMRFIQGRTLAEAVQAYHRQPTPLAFHDLLKRFVAVCQTIAYAHSRGIIHRDLKPANVLLGDYGETLVVDWGLAKRVGGGPEAQARPGEELTAAGGDTGAGSGEALTEAGQVLGTPAYMSPEQAAGRVDAVGPAADVYALGAILYEVLTGQPPYRGAGMGAVLAQVRRGPPSTPGQVWRGVPRALEAVCLRAMARSPRDRYTGAGEVAREVERWLADEPVVAYREPLPVRLVRWARRHRTLTTAAGGVLLTLLGATVLGGLVVRRAKEQAGALAQADALPAAGSASVPALLKDLEAHRDTVRPRLWARWQDPALTDGHQRLRLGLALANDAEVRARLVALARMADEPQEVLLVRDALQPYAAEVAPLLWGPVAEPATPSRERFRLLAILATLDPNSDRWAVRADEVVSALVRENILHVSGWAEALRPVRGGLISPLADVFRDGNRPGLERGLAADLLADYAGDQPQLLADLLMDADEKQFDVLFRKVQTFGARGLRLLTGEVDRKLPVDATEDAKEKLAKRQANAAVALLRMNQPVKVWPLLRRSGEPDDPRVRSYLIHRLGPLGAYGGAVVRQLEQEQDVTIRRALILSLGEFGEEAWGLKEKERLVNRLQQMYLTEADPGLHAATEWLLRQWKDERGWLKRTNEAWAQDRELRAKRFENIKQELIQANKKPKPQWYTTGQGQTMVVIPGPLQFMMGSPPNEVGGLHPREQLHLQQIGRTFAIAAKPVTVEQYLQFDRSMENDYSPVLAPTVDCPMHGTSWYMAAAYCNWLSKKEGIPEVDWCYQPNKDSKYDDGMTLAPDYLKRTGYRLPTEAEWEYACRAEALSSRYYGEAEELLGKYGWYVQNSRFRTWPAGSLKPNDLGLFDMHGNVWQWCHEPYREYPAKQGQETIDDREDSLIIAKDQKRILRGGAFDRPAVFVRSAHRDFTEPGFRRASLAFRPARTIR
jgi:formylglycine-generating enzyme required for sulfatase activity/tRNA A-37 threonylcarbamoyl transferase component Bud32